MRVKGNEKIPDFLQIRDEWMTLIGYFREDRLEIMAEKLGWDAELIYRTIKDLPYGVFSKINSDP